MTETNMWTCFLQEAHRNVSTKLPRNKSLLVLGANGSGKTTLISKLRKAETPNNGCGLEYSFLDVCDEYFDEHLKLGIWVLDGDPALSFLLKRVLNKFTFADTAVAIVVSMSTPWNILKQLEYWIYILKELKQNIALTDEEFRKLQCRSVQRWKSYIPISSEEQNDFVSETKFVDQRIEDEGILLNNLGIDIVVVVTKSDYISTLETDHGYTREHLNYIQQRIRRFCLQNGLSLIYTAAKRDLNCQLLYKYLVHKIYGFPFEEPAIVDERDSIFIPVGFDNMKNISQLFNNLLMLRPDDDYETVVPISFHYVKSNESMHEIVAEEEQIFLQKLLKISEPHQNLEVANMITEQNLSCSSPRTASSDLKTPLMNKADVLASQNCNTSELATFFSSLLKRGSRKTSPRNISAVTTVTSSTPMSHRNVDVASTKEVSSVVAKKISFRGRELFKNNSSN